MAKLVNGAGPAIDPAVATHLELSAVVFENDANESIQISLSDGRGLTWTPSMRVDQGTFAAKKLNDDSVAVFDDNIYVYWLDDRLAETEIYFNFSTDRGLTFQPFDLKVNKGFMTDAVTTARMAVDPRSVSPNDDIIVFLIAARKDGTGMDELYLNYSMDSGMTFLGAPIPFTFHNMLADIDSIDLAVEGGLIYGIWQDNFYRFMPDLDDVMFSAFDPFLGNFFFQDVMLNTNSPSTSAAVVSTNGLGNLIIGYTEQDPETAALRSGSHNLVVGIHHGYTSFGGQLNLAEGFATMIAGGSENLASGSIAAMSGGSLNQALGYLSVVFGGQVNSAPAATARLCLVARKTLQRALGRRWPVVAASPFWKVVAPTKETCLCKDGGFA
ncbi:MAG: hypothetical protein GY747_12410 [Planctomycetes bacterium]|nr:hypothetical protein [Planctomycetota bacterium]MCP4771796.1 hypothetical protein [Planctomycetota bacterium]MCP4860961.1 hypothetical protein [Planctomycetota bacterium]